MSALIHSFVSEVQKRVNLYNTFAMSTRARTTPFMDRVFQINKGLNPAVGRLMI